MTLGERIQLLRRRAGLTQRELGARLGCPPNAIVRLETGKIRDLKGARIVRLATIFGVSADVLLGLEPLEEERVERA